jgi:hypothetical protein
MIQFFFCYNQVSYVIAYEAAKNNPNKVFLIIAHGRVRHHKQSRVKAFKYHTILSFSLLIISAIFGNIEIILPHVKFGRITKWMSKYSKNLSYIDDGMDTFREKPKNIELERLRLGSKYYTFTYNIQLAKWLCILKVTPVCSIRCLMNDPKPPLNLTEYNCLVIESPGVRMNENYDEHGNVFFITHPSYIKNQSVSILRKKESGSNCSVEKTVSKFDGILVVGESMVLIFAILTYKDPSRISVSLTISQFNNLKSLQSLLKKCRYELILE